MADPQQLARLLDSVKEWNRWREYNNEQKIDLSEANLSQIPLRGVNLRQANLKKANLQESDLSQANLQRASLEGVNLRSGLTLIHSSTLTITFF